MSDLYTWDDFGVVITTVAVDASATFPAPSIGLEDVPTGAPDEPYVIRVVDMLGNVITNLTLADPGDILETLNAPDQWDITFPKDAYTRDDVDILGNASGPHEIQILLGGKVLAWGPALTPDGTGGPIRLTGAGVDWYFTKRNIDGPPVNLLPNGSFEDDLTGWHYLHGHTDSHVDATIITSPIVEGAKAVRITSSDGASPSRILGIQNDAVHFTTGAAARALTLSVSFILEEFDGPAYLKGGIELEGSVPGFGGPIPPGINQKSVALYNIDHTTPRGSVVRASLSIRIPPHTTWAIQAILFGVKGSIVWDAAELYVENVLSTNGITGSDPGLPYADASRIVRVLARETLTDRHLKSHLHIAVNAPDCGKHLVRSYPWADHTALDQALNEFLARDDCFEYGMKYTPTTRTLRLWPIATGGRGVDRSADVTLTYGAAPVTGYVPHVDGASTTTQATILGDTGGATREERWATDTAPLGGTVLQGIENASNSASFNSLAALARAIVAQRATPPRILEITIDRTPVDVAGNPTILQDLLGLGDHVTVDLVDGWWVFAGVWRIVQRVRHCRARTMTYTLNKVFA